MPDLSLRRFTDEEYISIKERAAVCKESMEAWAKAVLIREAQVPVVVHRRYVLRAYDLNGAVVEIRRVEDDMSHDMSRALLDAQRQAAIIAIELVKRNGPGEREEAVSVLKSAFPSPGGYVFETIM